MEKFLPLVEAFFLCVHGVHREITSVSSCSMLRMQSEEYQISALSDMDVNYLPLTKSYLPYPQGLPEQ